MLSVKPTHILQIWNNGSFLFWLFNLLREWQEGPKLWNPLHNLLLQEDTFKLAIWALKICHRVIFYTNCCFIFRNIITHLTFRIKMEGRRICLIIISQMWKLGLGEVLWITVSRKRQDGHKILGHLIPSTKLFLPPNGFWKKMSSFLTYSCNCLISCRLSIFTNSCYICSSFSDILIHVSYSPGG